MIGDLKKVGSAFKKRWRKTAIYSLWSSALILWADILAWLWKGRKLWGYRKQAFTVLLIVLAIGHTVVLYWQIGLVGERALYETLRLFVVESDVSLSAWEGSWAYRFLWFVRITVPALVAFGFLDVLMGALLKRPVFFGSNHIVIGGLGRLGRAICEQLLGENYEIVAIEQDPDNPNIEWLRSKGMRVFVDDMTQQQVLKHARVHCAAGFVAVAHDDIVNVDALDAALDLIEERGWHGHRRRMLSVPTKDGAPQKVWGLAQVYDPEFKRNMRHHFERRQEKEEDQDEQQVRVDFFNNYQRMASHLIDEKLVPAWEETNPEHFGDALFVIAGFGRFGWAVFHELLQRYFDEYPDWCYWLVDPTIDDEEIRYSKVLMDEVLPAGASIDEQRKARARLNEKWVPKPVDMLDYDLWLDIEEEHKQRPVYFLICTDNDVKNLDFAMRLMRRDRESRERGEEVYSDDLIVVTRLLHWPSFVERDGLDEHILAFEPKKLLKEVFQRGPESQSRR